MYPTKTISINQNVLSSNYHTLYQFHSLFIAYDRLVSDSLLLDNEDLRPAFELLSGELNKLINQLM